MNTVGLQYVAKNQFSDPDFVPCSGCSLCFCVLCISDFSWTDPWEGSSLYFYLVNLLDSRLVLNIVSLSFNQWNTKNYSSFLSNVNIGFSFLFNILTKVCIKIGGLSTSVQIGKNYSSFEIRKFLVMCDIRNNILLCNSDS